jgi:tetratricopeptide (TPR) repeat protein
MPPVPGAAAQAAQNAQAFARLQLQAKQVQRSPLIVEEMPAQVARKDGRIASPMPTPSPFAAPPPPPPPPSSRPPGAPSDFMVAPPPPPAPTNIGETPPPLDAASVATAPGGADIASLIMGTIKSSLPPPMAAAPPSSRPSASGMPAAASSGRLPAEGAPPGQPLTAEQTSLKQKIVERAAQITSQDYFQMLSLDRDADAAAVQKAFVSLAKVWHPDRLPPALVDVKDACSKVFAHLTEAHATLTDPKRRQDYMTLLKEGGATPDDQAKIQSVIEAATEFQKAEFHLKRNETAQAYEIAKRAHQLDPEQAEYLAMVTWIEAQRPEWSGREKTLEKIGVLDRCIKMQASCTKAYFWRGLLYKRIDEPTKAMKDFKKVVELDPRNLDAAREVRLHNIRGGAKQSSASGAAGKSQPETLGGLFGKLFKK